MAVKTSLTGSYECALFGADDVPSASISCYSRGLNIAEIFIAHSTQEETADTAPPATEECDLDALGFKYSNMFFNEEWRIDATGTVRVNSQCYCIRNINCTTSSKVNATRICYHIRQNEKLPMGDDRADIEAIWNVLKAEQPLPGSMWLDASQDTSEFKAWHDTLTIDETNPIWDNNQPDSSFS